MATKSNDAAFFFCLAREKNEKSGNNMDWDTKTKYIHNKKIKEIIRISGYNTRTLTLHRELPKEAEFSSTNFYSKPLA